MTRPTPPQAAIDAVEAAYLNLRAEIPFDERPIEWPRMVAEAAVSAAFAAVVPAGLFIAPADDGELALWNGQVYRGSRWTFPEAVWALLVALLPTREEA